jgi:hypothetical protein
MNQLLNTQDIISPLNRCYLDYAEWPAGGTSEVVINAFRYSMEQHAGLRLTFTPTTTDGQFGFRLDSAELIDEQLYIVWLLRWA